LIDVQIPNESAENVFYIGSGFEGVSDVIQYPANAKFFYPITKNGSIIELMPEDYSTFLE
jgi:hypothetical protein